MMPGKKAKPKDEFPGRLEQAIEIAAGDQHILLKSMWGHMLTSCCIQWLAQRHPRLVIARLVTDDLHVFWTVAQIDPDVEVLDWNGSTLLGALLEAVLGTTR
uniref:Uncharacterized protein n=1 Tax=viral metagenome TaxID=1070528 RepID=A0A6M3INJ5_9ZZZZ